MSASHAKALGQLQAEHGAVVLTGEPGTGKTALLLAHRERLGAGTAVSFVFNTALSFDGIVECMLADFGIAKPEESPARRLEALNCYLGERVRVGQRTALIVDEAQGLEVTTLAQIGLLSSGAGATASTRLTILLAGQPELEATLKHPSLRSLGELIEGRARIRPLDAEEVHSYLRHRLQVAGAPDSALFDYQAIGRIARYSGGIPRVINILGDHCLVFGYAKQRRRIDRRIADQAIAQLSADGLAPRAVFAGGTALASAVAGSARRLFARRG